MFLTELLPLGQELLRQPIAFAGGFVAGVLKLDLDRDPVKSWLTQQGTAPIPNPNHYSNGNGPQSINID
jgi:hypothetical protein